MTEAASKRPRATPPPLPRAATSMSGIRPIPQAPSPGVPGPLKQVLLRVDVGDGSPPEDPTEDRRTHWDAEQPVEFVAETHFVAGLSQDVSGGGVFVATYRRVAVGTKVHLGFELPDGRLVEARGVVRWVREQDDAAGRPGLGVAFTQMSDATLAALVDYCRAQPPLYFDF
jgi:uncharacterized protein (TIGR02266 family)